METRPWHKHYDEGVPVTCDYDELTLPQMLTRSAQAYPDTTALIFLNCKLTYRQLKEQVDRMATAFQTLGVKPGTRVAIHMPNIPQVVIAFQGALAAGAEVILTNPLYTPRELEHQWKDSGCEVAVTMDFLWDQVVRDVRDTLPVKQYIIASIPEYLRFPLNLLAPLKLKKQNPPRIAKVAPGPGVHLFKALVSKSAPLARDVDRSLDEIAVLQYTGGTTGPSKGAMLTHRNLSVNVQQTHAWFPNLEGGQEVILVCLPIFHAFGMTVGMNWAVLTGSTMVLVPNPRDISTLIESIVKHRVTLFPAVPALYNNINHFPGVEKMDLSSVKACFSGSAPLPDDVKVRFEKMTGSSIVEGFGMSETSPVATVNPLLGLQKIGSVGIPVPDTDVRIVDAENGTDDMPNGEEGELIVKGPQVMKGYWGREDATAETIRDGWLYTGDFATQDEDGFLRIVGRKKDMINCSGMKVFPDEVDNVLIAHESVLEAATIGVPDEKRGETVKSFIVFKPGAALSKEEVIAYCRKNLAPYKVPSQIEVLEELPKSSVMKVLRRELREMELARMKGA
jgi:long-chain acyl-CoA synthetase